MLELNFTQSVHNDSAVYVTNEENAVQYSNDIILVCI